MSIVATKDNGFNEIFEEFVGGRLETDESALDDPEYKAARDEQLKYEDEIRRLLGQNEKLFFDYDHAVSRRIAISGRHIYKQGVADGIRLCVETGLISK
jgi:Txe/YoeB family toxin of Txe-Axe toxin-antitoxin module